MKTRLARLFRKLARLFCKLADWLDPQAPGATIQGGGGPGEEGNNG